MTTEIGGFNSFLHIKRAAHGDAEAIELLADRSAHCAAYARDILTVTEALVFARMAASRGGIAEKARVLSLLAIAGEAIEALGNPDCQLLLDSVNAEAIARAELLTDECGGAGEWAADAFNHAVHLSGHNALTYSKIFRKALLEAAEG